MTSDLDGVRAKYKLELTKDDINSFVWVALDKGDNPFMVRTVERVDPPSDGYYYYDVTAHDDTKQQWLRGWKIEDES